MSSLLFSVWCVSLLNAICFIACGLSILLIAFNLILLKGVNSLIVANRRGREHSTGQGEGR